MESVGSASHFSATLYIMFSEGKPPSFSTFNFKFSITIICRGHLDKLLFGKIFNRSADAICISLYIIIDKPRVKSFQHTMIFIPVCIGLTDSGTVS